MTIEEWEASADYCHHPVFVTDDGIIPTCDICDGPQFSEGDDWNGETGNHYSCEADAEVGRAVSHYGWAGELR